jgi:L-alanine-DL-glutamate epimerase-like enolase superfamily enzyme
MTSVSRRDIMTRFLRTAAGIPLLNLLSPEGLLAQAREKAKPFNLKITGLKTFLVAPTVSPGAGIFVKIYTNQGLIGLGLATQTSKEVTTAAAIEEFTPALIGRDPTQIEAIWEDLYEGPRWRGGPLTAALSAVDIALWDILGQALGQPIHKLLGGPIHDKIRVYGGGGGITPESWAKTKADGYTASRVQWPTGSITEMIEYTKAMRKAAGASHELAIHGAGRLPTSEALQFMRGVEECNLMWVEEPIQMDDLEDWVHLRAHTTTPIATGERLTTKFAFNPYLTKHLIDFAQPDLCACGGISEGKKIAAIAEANRIRLAPHGPHGPAGALANFHLDAATPNFYVQETRSYTGQFDMDLHEGLIPVIKNGYCELPDRPGLGTVLNEKVAATRPYKPINRGSGIGLSTGVSAQEEAARAARPKE